VQPAGISFDSPKCVSALLLLKEGPVYLVERTLQKMLTKFSM
jgi:hypothetical protein